MPRSFKVSLKYLLLPPRSACYSTKWHLEGASGHLAFNTATTFNSNILENRQRAIDIQSTS